MFYPRKKTQGGFWDLTHKSNNDCPLTSQVKSNMIENQSDTSLSSQATLHMLFWLLFPPKAH